MFLFRHKNSQSKNDPRCDKNNFIFPKKKKTIQFPDVKAFFKPYRCLGGLQLFFSAS